jgi:hypothetical protein
MEKDLLDQTEKWALETWLIEEDTDKAFGIKPSWKALLRENQIRLQATMAKIWKKCVSTIGIPIIFGCKIIFNQSNIEDICKTEISSGQKEFLQITLTMGQEKNKWSRESLELEQRKQDVSNPECMDKEIRDLVGTIFQTIFQRNSLSRWVSLSFQRPF